MTLNDLAYEAWLSAEDNGWHKPRPDEYGVERQASTFERLGLIHSEVSEAYEAVRRGTPDHWQGKPEGLASELADIIIRTCELAQIQGIDLDFAVDCKMCYNRLRSDVPVRDGGKSI